MLNHNEAKMQSSLDIFCKVHCTKSAKQTVQGGDGMKAKIPELRKKNKLSQEELALAVGSYSSNHNVY